MSKRLLLFICISLYCISNATSTEDSISNKCYTCRGISCLRTTAQEVTETCIYNLDSCATIFEKFTVVAKGCLLNMPVELRSKCNDRSNPECQVCNGGLCNNLGRKDFKCYECDAQNDTNCARNTSSLTPVQCKIPSAPNSYCFTDFRRGQVKRGCSLHVKDQKECLADNNCVLCSAEDGQGCNIAINDVISGGVKKSAAVALVVLCASIAKMSLKF